MTEVISVVFKSGGKMYYFSPNGNNVEKGDRIVVETANGTELVECIKGNHEVEDELVVQPLRPMIRAATAADMRYISENPRREAEAFKICEKKIEEYGLEMRLVRVEYNFDGSKIMFFFTSESRIDFRDLVRDLAGIFKTRIILRQIGVRDEARMLGGLGICGKSFCCAGFLEEFQPVSIKMAKTQSLSLNPSKISGTCGRLMCCLKYEQEAYEDAARRAPKVNSTLELDGVTGTVSAVNLLRETATLRVGEGNDERTLSFKDGELKLVSEEKSGGGELMKYLDRLESAEKSGADKTEQPERVKQSGHRNHNSKQRKSAEVQQELSGADTVKPETKKTEPKKGEPRKPEQKKPDAKKSEQKKPAPKKQPENTEPTTETAADKPASKPHKPRPQNRSQNPNQNQNPNKPQSEKPNKPDNPNNTNTPNKPPKQEHQVKPVQSAEAEKPAAEGQPPKKKRGYRPYYKRNNNSNNNSGT